jgi:hypothetical protein
MGPNRISERNPAIIDFMKTEIQMQTPRYKARDWNVLDQEGRIVFYADANLVTVEDVDQLVDNLNRLEEAAGGSSIGRSKAQS